MSQPPPHFNIAVANDLVRSVSVKTGQVTNQHSQAAFNLLAREQLQCAVALVEHTLKELDRAHKLIEGRVADSNLALAVNQIILGLFLSNANGRV